MDFEGGDDGVGEILDGGGGELVGDLGSKGGVGVLDGRAGGFDLRGAVGSENQSSELENYDKPKKRIKKESLRRRLLTFSRAP